MDRPALTRLLEDVDQGLVDMIVVYKIDHSILKEKSLKAYLGKAGKNAMSFVNII